MNTTPTSMIQNVFKSTAVTYLNTTNNNNDDPMFVTLRLLVFLFVVVIFFVLGLGCYRIRQRCSKDYNHFLDVI
ncbi:hypothetical protein MAR_021866 [Mya arenaria]|uniref:Uncharacterized protein n=1 Tax=Mya arenaria TaxID=6604 RepID=A0ABY7EC26_MYAAR|nr:hypothetical protein MAR_021866 [Mya arenaria]